MKKIYILSLIAFTFSGPHLKAAGARRRPAPINFNRGAVNRPVDPARRHGLVHPALFYPHGDPLRLDANNVNGYTVAGHIQSIGNQYARFYRSPALQLKKVNEILGMLQEDEIQENLGGILNAISELGLRANFPHLARQ